MRRACRLAVRGKALVRAWASWVAPVFLAANTSCVPAFPERPPAADAGGPDGRDGLEVDRSVESTPGVACHSGADCSAAFPDCLSFATVCYREFPGGYCTKLNAPALDCGPNGYQEVCTIDTRQTESVCLRQCATNKECRMPEGYLCCRSQPGDEFGVCLHPRNGSCF